MFLLKSFRGAAEQTFQQKHALTYLESPDTTKDYLESIW